MSSGGQTADSLEEFGTWELPRLVGILTVCGYPRDEATHVVRKAVARAISGGLEGGRDAPSLLAEQVLLDARPPKTARPPVDALDRALAPLGWEERLATVISVVPGTSRLGPGRPDEVAASLGARVADAPASVDDTRPRLTDLITDAVAAHAGTPEPGLVDQARRAARRMRLRLAVVVVVIVAVLLALGIAVAARAGSTEVDHSDAPEDFPITQWVAVLRNGATPAELAAEARQLEPAAGVYVFTDRWSCYEGFPAGTATADGWFLGLAANDRGVIDDIVTSIGRTPLVEALVRQVCVQPPPSGGPVVVQP
jgi:hypothetical protein